MKPRWESADKSAFCLGKQNAPNLLLLYVFQQCHKLCNIFKQRSVRLCFPTAKCLEGTSLQQQHADSLMHLIMKPQILTWKLTFCKLNSLKQNSEWICSSLLSRRIRVATPGSSHPSPSKTLWAPFQSKNHNPSETRHTEQLAVRCWKLGDRKLKTQFSTCWHRAVLRLPLNATGVKHVRLVSVLSEAKYYQGSGEGGWAWAAYYGTIWPAPLPWLKN